MNFAQFAGYGAIIALIAGGRHYRLTAADFAVLDAIHKAHKVEKVLSGKASGADHDGEQWAHSRRIYVSYFPADWRRYGKAAGPMRNETMAQAADALAFFPGGTGTADMLRRAKKHGLTIFDLTKTQNPPL